MGIKMSSRRTAAQEDQACLSVGKTQTSHPTKKGALMTSDWIFFGEGKAGLPKGSPKAHLWSVCFGQVWMTSSILATLIHYLNDLRLLGMTICISPSLENIRLGDGKVGTAILSLYSYLLHGEQGKFLPFFPHFSPLLSCNTKFLSW
jgi:hypothetical protein